MLLMVLVNGVCGYFWWSWWMECVATFDGPGEWSVWLLLMVLVNGVWLLLMVLVNGVWLLLMVLVNGVCGYFVADWRQNRFVQGYLPHFGCGSRPLLNCSSAVQLSKCDIAPCADCTYCVRAAWAVVFVLSGWIPQPCSGLGVILFVLSGWIPQPCSAIVVILFVLSGWIPQPCSGLGVILFVLSGWIPQPCSGLGVILFVLSGWIPQPCSGLGVILFVLSGWIPQPCSAIVVIFFVLSGWVAWLLFQKIKCTSFAFPSSFMCL